MAFALTRRRFTVHDYYKMAKAGILTEDDRVELIGGQILEMTPIGSRHAGKLDRINDYFRRRLNLDEVIVRIQNPVRLSPESEPRPDLAIVPVRSDFYELRHPGPDEVLLIVEVAESSLEFDLTVKADLYGRALVPELWVVDIESELVTVFTDPSPDGYQSRAVLGQGDLAVVESLGLVVTIGDFWGAETPPS